jgi:hypothetical protein
MVADHGPSFAVGLLDLHLGLHLFESMGCL